MSRETELWADSYYPWLPNGWIKCSCGDYFNSDRYGTARAVDLHADHVAASPAHNEPLSAAANSVEGNAQ